MMNPCQECKRNWTCPPCRTKKQGLIISKEEKLALINTAFDQAFEKYSTSFIRCNGFIKRFHHANLSGSAN